MSSRKEKERNEDKRNPEREEQYPIKVPAQFAFEVMHFMRRQKDAVARGFVIDGQERVLERLADAIPEDFQNMAVLGNPLEEHPVMAELQLSYYDLECIGKSVLALPTVGSLIEEGIDPQEAKTYGIARSICLGYHFLLDTLFEGAGGEANIPLVNEVYIAWESSKAEQ